jgi:hypothetical protein
MSEVLLFSLTPFRAILERSIRMLTYDGRRPCGLCFLWRLVIRRYLKLALLHPHFHVKIFYHGDHGAGNGRHGHPPVLSFHQRHTRPDPADRRLFVERRAGIQGAGFAPGFSALSRTRCTCSAAPQASACSQIPKRGWWRPCAVISGSMALARSRAEGIRFSLYCVPRAVPSTPRRPLHQRAGGDRRFRNDPGGQGIRSPRPARTRLPGSGPG